MFMTEEHRETTLWNFVYMVEGDCILIREVSEASESPSGG